MNTPVGLIIFNRPEPTARVFAEIAKAQPRLLLVAADGPRPDRPEDAAKCAAARAIIDRADWPGEVIRNFRDTNLGPGRGAATAIQWFFEQVERAIILEDDCVPDPTFFPFCEELLERYANDERVMQINGHNFQFGQKRGTASYYFTKHNICWGWASWRRAWKRFDIAVKDWPRYRNTSWARAIVGDPRAAAFWSDKFEQAYQTDGNPGNWDFQWDFAHWTHGGLSISPNASLVSNIGAGEDATHSKTVFPLLYLPTAPMSFPLIHPTSVETDVVADRCFIEQAVVPFLAQPPTTFGRIMRLAKRLCAPELGARIKKHARGWWTMFWMARTGSRGLGRLAARLAGRGSGAVQGARGDRCARGQPGDDLSV